MRWFRRGGTWLFSAYLGAVMFAVITIPFAVGLPTFIQEYQTFIVGAPGLLALAFAIMQWSREHRRDTVNVIRGYEPELDALEDIRAIASTASDLRYPSIAGILGNRRSEGHSLPLDTEQELRALGLQCSGGVSADANTLAAANLYYIRLLGAADRGSGPLSKLERSQIESCLENLHSAANALYGTASKRNQAILDRINLYLDLPKSNT